MIRAAALSAVVLASTAQASVDDNEAARCAAFWSGYALYAVRTAHLDGAGEARADASRYRKKAVEETGDAAGVDAFIDRETPRHVQMIEAYIYDNDEQSRELFERLTKRCG